MITDVDFIKTMVQTIWASILVLGWFKILIAIVIIAILTKIQPLMGLLGFILFVAYLLHWI